MLDLLEVEAKRRNVSLSLEVAPDTPRLLANADQVQQVVFNLVRNSLRATSAGGRIDVGVTASEMGTRALAAQVLSAKEPAVRFEVRDDGCGIATEDLPKLFEPFFTTRNADGGTGLGLAVVRSIVDQYRGTIHVDSAPGGGASFVVLLPIREQAVEQGPSGTGSSAKEVQRGT